MSWCGYPRTCVDQTSANREPTATCGDPTSESAIDSHVQALTELKRSPAQSARLYSFVLMTWRGWRDETRDRGYSMNVARKRNRDEVRTVGRDSVAHRASWFAAVVLMFATAAFVPVRIVYKQHQSHVAAPGSVVIANFAYSPEVLTVPSGTKVTFANSDGAAHTATASDKSFDTGRLEQGMSFEVTVKSSVDYFCSIHQYMTAKIEVTG